MTPDAVPDDVYTTLAEAAATRGQSLSAYVVAQLTEIADAAGIGDHLAAYEAPRDSGVTMEDAVAAVRAVRDAS